MVCGYSLFTPCSFDNKKSKHDFFYRGQDSMKKFCVNLKEQATEIIDCEGKEMLPLTRKKKKQSFCHICKKQLMKILRKPKLSNRL